MHDTPPFLDPDRAWAKLDENGLELPLTEHAADVAAVMRSLIHEPAWARNLELSAGRLLTECDLDRLTALAFIHDLGKANVGFWAQKFPNRRRVGHTDQTAALFFSSRIKDCAEAQRLRVILGDWGAWTLFCAAMAHHGRPLEAYAAGSIDARNRIRDETSFANLWLSTRGYAPLRELNHLLDAAEERFPAAFSNGPLLPDAHAFVSLFCGLLTMADWLGSDTFLFPVHGPYGPGREPARCDATLRAILGRSLGALATPNCSFAHAFAVTDPRGLQSISDRSDLGSVALIEAETGSGKTEAALWRWLALRRRGLVDGLYFALPTRSAAVQLHARVQSMLGRVFGPGAPEAVLAVSGYLRAGDAEGQSLPDFGVVWSDSDTGDGRWAAERPKRFLSARVAIGTIDQALMSGLKLRHAHLRAAALSRSLLVIDEVHASDAFMGEVLKQVIANHRTFGGHVLLLSATLTAAARRALLGRSETPELGLEDAVGVPYPALSGHECDSVSGSDRSSVVKRVELKVVRSMNDPDAIAALAATAAQAGAAVLVVRNTVAGAVAVARRIERLVPSLTFEVNGIATVHHGRFGPNDRRLLDAAVNAAFGKGRLRAGRILCGTQTLEQSLDIDADLLITDLAPMDVLLQRIGRLHRHVRDDRGDFSAARAVVLTPETRDLSAYLGKVQDRHGLGPIQDGTGVYPDLLVLEATLRLLENNPSVLLPEDNRRLVEGALHSEVIEGLKRQLGTQWCNHANTQVGTIVAERDLARQWLLDLSAPFESLLFLSADEAIATRLGTKDRIVEFRTPFEGPFGQMVDRLTVPGWMSGGIPPEAEPVIQGIDSNGVVFRLGKRAFTYGRWGLESPASLQQP